MREQLRKAGMAIRNFDDAYAQKVRDLGERLPAPLSVSTGMTAGVPLTYVPELSTAKEIASQKRDKQGPISMGQARRHQAVEAAMAGGMMASSAAARYALPAGGVTLAGVGLYDLTTQFGNGADYPEDSQLTLMG